MKYQKKPTSGSFKKGSIPWNINKNHPKYKAWYEKITIFNSMKNPDIAKKVSISKRQEWADPNSIYNQPEFKKYCKLKTIEGMKLNNSSEKISKAKKGKSSPFKNKTFEEIHGEKSDELRQRISKTVSIRIKEGKCGFKKGDFHHAKNPEMREKMRINALNQKHIYSNTSIEIALQEELKKRHIEFDTNKNVENICRPDIILWDKKIVVQADGDYYHNYPYGKDKDYVQDAKLREKGWTVIRFWEHDIKKDASACIDFVENMMNVGSIEEEIY